MASSSHGANQVPNIGGRWGALVDEDDTEAFDVNTVQTAYPHDEITIDSGAGKNVWPRERREGGKITPMTRRVRLTAANGQEMKVDGEKAIRFGADGKQCSMKFLVTEVKKPLAAVSSIVDEGNIVVFGPGPSGSFIQNCTTGEKIIMQRKQGTYVMKVDFASGDRRQASAGKTQKNSRSSMDIGMACAEPDEHMCRKCVPTEDSRNLVFTRQV